MPLTELNKEQLHRAILMGCQSLIDQKERTDPEESTPFVCHPREGGGPS